MSDMSALFFSDWTCHGDRYGVVGDRVVLVGTGGSYTFDPLRDTPGAFLDFVMGIQEQNLESVLKFARSYGDLLSNWTPNSPLESWYKAAHDLKAFIAIGPVPSDWERQADAWSVLGRLSHTLEDSPIQDSVEVGFGPEGLILHIKTLLGALWIQAAEAAAHRTKYVRCSECARHLLVNPRMRPGPNVFCSSKCRYEHFKVRKEKALALVSAGATAREAATSVGSTAQTVANWIKREKLVATRSTGGAIRQRRQSMLEPERQLTPPRPFEAWEAVKGLESIAETAANTVARLKPTKKASKRK